MKKWSALLCALLIAAYGGVRAYAQENEDAAGDTTARAVKVEDEEETGAQAEDEGSGEQAGGGEEEDGEEEADEQAQEAGGTAKAILNSAALTPAESGSAALNRLVEGVLEEVTTPEMDTYEKVKACYDYLLENMSYASSMRYLGVSAGDVTCGDIYYAYGEVDGFAAVALTAHKGMCNGYAAAFIAMTRALGLESYLVEGQTASAGGGYAYHKWAEVQIDGTAYLFDPQLDQDLSQSGLPAYSVFCKTYDQVPGRYVLYGKSV